MNPKTQLTKKKYIYIYIYTHTHTHTHIYIHTYIYTYGKSSCKFYRYYLYMGLISQLLLDGAGTVVSW